MNRYHIVHKTTYKYQKAVTLSHNEGHLLPCDDEHQTCESASLRVQPEPAVIHERTDIYGNRVNYFSLEQPHKIIEVVAESWIRRQVTDRIPLDPDVRAAAARNSPSWETVRDNLSGLSDDAMLQEYIFASPMIAAQAIDSPGVEEFARSVFTPGRPVLEACVDLNARIFNDYKYDSGFTRIGTPLSKVIEHKRGVCQDFAHLFLACVRNVGLPGRYASGYLETKPPPGRPRLQGADASHAWASVFMPGPGGGWVDFDPTNNLIAGNQHIVLGYGRDYSDVTPLKGVIFGGGKHTVHVEVDVVPVED